MPDDGTSTSQSNGVSAATADIYLAEHNRVRAATTKPANYPGTWVPLPPVTWSAEVAASAQQWADHLRDTRGCLAELDPSSTLGENGADGTIGYSAKSAVAAWAEEASVYTYAPVYVFEDATGHYTQIVWRNTTEIGCGISKCDTGYLVHICRYRPPGNVIGEQPY